MDPRTSVLNLSRQPPTVDFINNRLPDFHTVFVDPPVHYDPMASQYVPNSQVPIAWTDTKAMSFWTIIFPEAMVKFKSSVTEPKGRSNTRYHIHEKPNWDTVYATLESARSKYQKEGGKVGWLRQVRRKVADDYATPLAQVTQIAKKCIPENPYSTPVLGALGILLDAVKIAASVRKEVLEGLDGLIPIFSDVEVFLGTFPTDSTIRNTSIDLIITTLEAVEQAIGFFISNEFLKGGKAFFMREEYEKTLVEALGKIGKKSKSLMEEAAKSHMLDSQWYSQETQKLLNRLVKGQKDMADTLNSVEQMLSEHVREKDRELEAARQGNLFLRFENERLQSISPMPSLQFLPPSQPQRLVAEWGMNQEALRRLLDIPDLDLADMDFISDRKTQLPAKQRAQVEQIVNTQLFRNWIVSPSGAKLLVQWTSRPPSTIAEVSPLSGKPRFMSVQWFCGQHIEPSQPGRSIGGRAILLSLIDQLLRQHVFDMQLLHQAINLAVLQGRELRELFNLFHWLMRRLPQAITLFCIIDGVFLYEREEFCEEALQVLAELLQFTQDQSVPATVKVLFTSTPGPDIVKAPFEKDEVVLNVDTLPRLAWAPSGERMARELGNGLGEQVYEC
ncbi:uncharacterized protein BCR38DRAFT_466838 [Pseudomassariella vexata]|uniref:Fungal STAND N-terminal Goodbye domain-containing protein n=1 Tax=Pseudomassariella vexata TaxID=1141098 RepID=A0A1Y2DS12_9PEZI|nr:uncharacterized protein BCR38DRAFT_466838 [Pseudomassariella vexata]ORY62060.1 hypothetical protein BCR38DRAFT_466838 [Pseudomassariella vexata]